MTKLNQDRHNKDSTHGQSAFSPALVFEHASRAAPIRVILADNQTLFRQGIAALLRAEKGVDLLAETDTGPEAWSKILQLRPDVAILSGNLTGVYGDDLMRRITRANFDTKALLLGEFDDPVALVQAKNAGSAGYVFKQQSFEDLILAVWTVASGGSFAAPRLRKKLRDLENLGCAPATLSAREREVTRLIALGNNSKEIARQLQIRPQTVNTYRERLMDKLNAHTVADVVRYAMRVGLVY